MAEICGVRLDDDEEVATSIRVAQEALEGYEERSWLEWAGKELMPRLAEVVATEEAKKEREEAEERERKAEEARVTAEEAKREAEAEQEAERQRREAERKAVRDKRSGELLQRYQANAISAKEFQDGLAALEHDESDVEAAEDDPMEVREAPKVQAGTKRRVREDEETETVVGDGRKVSREDRKVIRILMG